MSDRKCVYCGLRFEAATPGVRCAFCRDLVSHPEPDPCPLCGGRGLECPGHRPVNYVVIEDDGDEGVPT